MQNVLPILYGSWTRGPRVLLGRRRDAAATSKAIVAKLGRAASPRRPPSPAIRLNLATHSILFVREGRGAGVFVCGEGRLSCPAAERNPKGGDGDFAAAEAKPRGQSRNRRRQSPCASAHAISSAHYMSFIDSPLYEMFRDFNCGFFVRKDRALSSSSFRSIRPASRLTS